MQKTDSKIPKTSLHALGTTVTNGRNHRVRV